jgi:microcystin-dependent protein
MEVFIGTIQPFAFIFAPRNWALCNGQIMPIAQNTAMFSLLGTTYGGNGQTTFGLPNLQGRMPIGMGQGPGLPDYSIGEASGSPSTVLNSNQMPSHSHAVQVQVGGAPSNPAVAPALPIIFSEPPTQAARSLRRSGRMHCPPPSTWVAHRPARPVPTSPLIS